MEKGPGSGILERAVRETEESLRLPGGLSIRPEELRFEFTRAGGPGGQNVNKVATRAVLRFDLVGSPSLPPEAKEVAARALASRLTGEGHLVLAASEHRSQVRNRAAAVGRLLALLRTALAPRKRRRPTRPHAGAVARRLRRKRLRSERKRSRARPSGEE